MEKVMRKGTGSGRECHEDEKPDNTKSPRCCTAKGSQPDHIHQKVRPVPVKKSVGDGAPISRQRLDQPFRRDVVEYGNKGKNIQHPIVGISVEQISADRMHKNDQTSQHQYWAWNIERRRVHRRVF